METEAHNAQLIQDAALKVFNQPLSSYKKKNELCAISLEAVISDQGTITELVDHISKYLQANHECLQDNPCFSGLLQTATTWQSKQANFESSSSSQNIIFITGNPHIWLFLFIIIHFLIPDI